MTDTLINQKKLSAPRRTQFEGMVFEIKPKITVFQGMASFIKPIPLIQPSESAII